MRFSVKNFFYISVILAALAIISCSRFDDTSSFGRDIIADRAQDGMQNGAYNTVLLTGNVYSSVADDSSGRHIYVDSLRSGGMRTSQWGIGNWKNEETVLMMRHRRRTAADSVMLRISDILHRLTLGDSVEVGSIRAQLQWTNLTGLNPQTPVNVEIGVIFGDPAKENERRFFPINYAVLNTRTSTNSIEFPVESYLLFDDTTFANPPHTPEHITDSTFISRFVAKHTRLTDTATIDSVFRKDAEGVWRFLENDAKSDTTVWQGQYASAATLTSDSLITWRNVIPLNSWKFTGERPVFTAFYDSARTKIYDGAGVEITDGDTLPKQDPNDPNISTLNLRYVLFNSAGDEVAAIRRSFKSELFGLPAGFGDTAIYKNTWLSDGEELLRERTFDTLFITYNDTVVYHQTNRNWIPDGMIGDSLIRHVKHMTAINTDDTIFVRDTITNAVIDTIFKPFPDTIWQTGEKYITALKSPSRIISPRSVGGLDASTEGLAQAGEGQRLSHELNMYLRVNKDSPESILHLASPTIRISYMRKVDVERNVRTWLPAISFTDTEVITTQKDAAFTDDVAVNSGALQRFAVIDLNLKPFFDVVESEQFLSLGIAELDIMLDAAKTDFPAQYGDSMLINAILTDTLLTPRELFALAPSDSNARRTNFSFIYRNDQGAREGDRSVRELLKMPLHLTLGDYLQQFEIFQNPERPQKAYLYLWLDDWTMGRIFLRRANINFTYILQSRKEAAKDDEN